MKKLLSILLVLVMCLTSAPLAGFVGLELPEWSFKASAATEYTEGYYTYTVENNEATITEVSNSIKGDIVIPDTLGGYKVIAIGEFAFMSCDAITSVIIPNSISTIDNGAFTQCSSIRSVTIPNSVTTIDVRAFYYCKYLAEITIPDSVTKIGQYAFDGCYSLTNITVDKNNAYYSSDEYGVLFNKNKDLLVRYPIGNQNTSYTIPDSVITINDYAFFECASLINITIPDGVTKMNKAAFRGCKALTSIVIPDSVEMIEAHTFYDCNIKHFAFKGTKEQWENLTLGMENVEISDDTYLHFEFDESKDVNEKIVPATCIEKGSSETVCSCGYVYIKNEISALGHDGEWEVKEPTCTEKGERTVNCTRCGEFVAELIEPFGHTGEWITIKEPTCTEKGEKTRTCTRCGQVATEILKPLGHTGEWETIKEPTCTEKGEQTMTCTRCGTVETKVITAGHDGEWRVKVTATCCATGLEERICTRCGEDEKREIPRLPHKEEIEIPAVVPTCTKAGFTETVWCYICGAIIKEAEVIPALGHDGDWKFVKEPTCTENGEKTVNCSRCKEFVTEDVPALGHKWSGWVYDNDKLVRYRACTFDGCDAREEEIIAYKEGYYIYTVENGEATIIDVDDSINGDIVIPDTLGGYKVTSIGDDAFSHCNALTSITIPDSIKVIGRTAFFDCYSLTSVIIPDGVTEIGYGAFSYCDSLISITIPDSVTTIEFKTFASCPNLKTVEFGNGVTTIGEEAFSRCHALTEVTMGNSITTIGDFAFFSCVSLENIFIPDSVITIGDSAFSACYSLENVIIGEGVTTIGYEAFNFCLSLTELVIPSNVEYIGELAFSDLLTVEKIYVETMTAEIEPISLGANRVEIKGISKEDFISKLKLAVITEDDESLWNEIDSYMVPIENFVDWNTVPIYCHSGSTAEAYAIANNAPHVLTHFYKEWTYDYDNMVRTRQCKFCDYTETEKLETTTEGDVEIIEPENPDTDFEVDEITPTDDKYIIIDKAIGENGSVVKAFDITLTNKEGVHVQPNGTIKVKLPLDWSKQGEYKVYRVNDDGTLTDMNAYRQGSHMVFDTDHFSYYVIVEVSTDNTDAPDEPDSPVKPDTPEEDPFTCKCHKNGFMNFIYKILNFFRKIFGMAPCCDC